MTNRKDLIDKALLRPGRFEVHIEISLPNEQGRLEILEIHTAEMRENKRLDKNVELEYYAREAKNFSGAELAGLVRSATSFALERCYDVLEPEEVHISEDKVVINSEDFSQALSEITPAFGKNQDQLTDLLPECGFITWDETSHLLEECLKLIERLVNSPVVRSMSLLLVGPPGSGKTSIAVNLGMKVSAPFVRIVTPEQFLGKSDQTIAGELHSIFKDVYRSSFSLLIIDNIEHLLSYSDVGHVYSNSILQALLILMKKPPPSGKRLFIIGTTADEKALKLLRLHGIFTKIFQVPLVQRDNNPPITMQQLLIDIENERLDLHPDEFLSKLKKLGKSFEENLVVIKKKELPERKRRVRRHVATSLSNSNK